MGMKRKIDDWIDEALKDTNAGKKCTAIVLMHRSGQHLNEVYNQKFGDDGGHDAIHLANLFMEKARNAINDTPGSHGFLMLAFYDGRQEPGNRFAFREEGGYDMGGELTEPPTKEGRVQQDMRWGEAGFKFFFQQISGMVGTQQELLKESNRDNKDLRTENRELIGVMKDVMMQLSTSNTEQRLKLLEYERSTKERETFFRMLPAAVNGLTGTEVFPQNAQDTALIDEFIENLDEEKLATIQRMNLIPAHLMGAFMARAAAYMKKKREVQEAAQRAVTGVVTNDDGEQSDNNSRRPNSNSNGAGEKALPAEGETTQSSHSAS